MPQNNYQSLVTNYLKKHGIPGWKLELTNEKKFSNIVVVPAIQEYENIKLLLGSLVENDPSLFDETLIIFVVNNKQSVSEEVKTDNKKSIELLQKIIRRNAADEFLTKIISSDLNLGLVNASGIGKELPEKDAGVGLARKLGMDLALSQFEDTNSRKKILICLDADCTVERNYLTSIVKTFNKENLSAAYVKYEHPFSKMEEETKAIVCYEIFLHYYVLGLKYANSPFAFPTIGSTMLCDAEGYIKIGGMNKKKAAEDFYFMEKLAKITKIEGIDLTKVYPAGRGSWRVPFGTGQRINRYFAGKHQEYVLYDPACFDVLKLWLEKFNDDNICAAEEYLDAAKVIHPALNFFLLQNSFENDWNNILNGSRTSTQIQRQKVNWFDGFRTLKLIHYLRDVAMPQVNMFDALDFLFAKIENGKKIERAAVLPPLEIQIEYLNHLRKIV
jgi:hypothetical protein